MIPKRIKLFFGCFAIAFLAGCNYFTFTPRSKQNIRRETPSILIFDRIVEFREKEMGWPTSRADFISKDIRYYEVMDGFPYQQLDFNIVDSNTMVLTFSEHIKDVRKQQETKKTDLNAYNGRVRFYKENGKFLWKLKMK